jgi:hypothetical protein
MDIYWDTLYGSFAFVVRDALPGEQIIYQENLSKLLASRRVKKPVAHNTASAFPPLAAVELTYNHHKYRTIPDRDGNIKFYGKHVEGLDTGTIIYPGSRSVKKVDIIKAYK